MKIAKKEVLRDLRPEIVEKERSEKEKKEEMAATLKVRIVGKDVEKKEGDKVSETQSAQSAQSSQSAQAMQGTQATPGSQTTQESATKPGEKEEAQEEVEAPVITFHL